MPYSDLADSTPRIESDPEESVTAHTRSRHTLHNLLHHYTPTFTYILTKCSLFPYGTVPFPHVPFGNTGHAFMCPLALSYYSGTSQ